MNFTEFAFDVASQCVPSIFVLFVIFAVLDILRTFIFSPNDR